MNQNSFNLEKAVESTTSAYCTESSRVFDDFLLHRMGDTVSVKKHQKHEKIQHISHSRYDSTAFSRFNWLSIKLTNSFILHESPPHCSINIGF